VWVEPKNTLLGYKKENFFVGGGGGHHRNKTWHRKVSRFSGPGGGRCNKIKKVGKCRGRGKGVNNAVTPKKVTFWGGAGKGKKQPNQKLGSGL